MRPLRSAHRRAPSGIAAPGRRPSRCASVSANVVAPIMCGSPRASIGLSMFPASIAPSAAPGTHDGVQLVDEQEDAAFGRLHFAEYGLGRSSNSPRYLAPAINAPEGEHGLVPQPFGDVAAHDALGQALNDGGLAHRGLRSRRGCSWSFGTGSGSLGESRITPDHRVELPAPRVGDQVLPYFSSASYADSGVAEVTLWLPRTAVSDSRNRSRVIPCSVRRRAWPRCPPRRERR